MEAPSANPVDLLEETVERLNRTMDRRPLNKPLVGETAPDLSISNVVFREAPAAFVSGLFVASVLASLTACEVFLTERYTRAWQLRVPGFPGTPEDWLELNREADERARSIRGLERLLRGLSKVGQWIAPSMSQKPMTLSQNRNDLAHYRPVLNEVVSVDSKDGAIVASFKPSFLLDSERQEKIAMESLCTMFDLSESPVVSFNPEAPPAPDWEPPAFSV